MLFFWNPCSILFYFWNLCRIFLLIFDGTKDKWNKSKREGIKIMRKWPFIIIINDTCSSKIMIILILLIVVVAIKFHFIAINKMTIVGSNVSINFIISICFTRKKKKWTLLLIAASVYIFFSFVNKFLRFFSFIRNFVLKYFLIHVMNKFVCWFNRFEIREAEFPFKKIYFLLFALR